MLILVPIAHLLKRSRERERERVSEVDSRCWDWSCCLGISLGKSMGTISSAQ